MEVSFIIATSIFMLFVFLILVSTINYLTRTPESAVILGLRDNAKSIFSSLFGTGSASLSQRTATDLYRTPILVEESNGTDRVNEVIALQVDFDEDCDQKSSWNNTIRVYDQNFNELPSKISYQDICSSQWLNDSIVTFLVNVSANSNKRVYVYSINNSDTIAPRHNLTIVGYWPLSENGGTLAKDFSGYSNNGTLSNFGSSSISGWQSGTNCKYNSCLAFDGADDIVNVSYSNALNVSPEFTIAFWVKGVDVNNEAHVFSKYNNDFYVRLNPTGTSPRLTCSFTSVSDSGNGVSTSFENSTWIHIACTYNGTLLTLYKNGVEVATQSRSGAVRVSGDPLALGAQSRPGLSSLYFFNGTLDDARLYNKSLSVNEIKSLANATQVTVTSFPQGTITAISAKKVQTLLNNEYKGVKASLGGDFDFRIEISENQ